MASMTTPRKLPRLLKATYLADQEFLLEETRATALFYFPGPVVWLLVFGALTWITEAGRRHWGGQLTPYTNDVLHHLSKTEQTYLFYAFGLLFLLGILWAFVRYLRWIRTVYAVTNRRVIVQRGILSRDFDEIPVLQVRGVDVHQSVGERMLGFGTVRVSSEGGSRLGNEDWRGIPKPFRFQKLIEDASQGAGPAATAPR
ncbi:MAG TPA: PH domain-containing protein [Thermoplasmata archaeon]|nr:PH domain-containing protein [Thermoplasmata archaeon]